MPSAPASPRVLVRASERGVPFVAPHPYNPRAEVHGIGLSRLAGLARIAVNLDLLPPGKESAEYHRHHREEEWVFVLEGRGIAEVDDAVHEVGPGDFVAFPPGVAHLLRNPSPDAPLAFLVGGEILPDVDVADFPRLRRRLVRMGARVAIYPWEAEIPFLPGGELPAGLLGEAAPGARSAPLVRAGERPAPRTFRHPQNPRSEVALTWLSRPALRRISAGIAAVPAGRESFVKHVHRHDEEWMFVLSGRGEVELGDATLAVGPGDFLGFPPGGLPHALRAAADGALVTLQGGDAWSRDTVEIVDFPELGLRKTFVGTRSAMTFRLDADVEPGERRPGR
jgi:uncharacterized cupin superfamily protein